MALPEPSESLTTQVKLGNNRVLRVCVVGDVVAFTRGQVVTRKVREDQLMPGGALNHKWHVTSTADSFVSDCSPLTVPLRLLSELRAVLARVAREYPQSDSI